MRENVSMINQYQCFDRSSQHDQLMIFMSVNDPTKERKDHLLTSNVINDNVTIYINVDQRLTSLSMVWMLCYALMIK
jgi:hypothetical protein